MLKDKKEISVWLKQYGIKDYSIDDDGVVHATNVLLSDKNLIYIPIQFGIIDDFFDISNNRLLNLRGSPTQVKSFDCGNNQLVTLAGAPTIVDGLFDCRNNYQLTSLKHVPKKAHVFNFNGCSIDSLLDFDSQFDLFFHCHVDRKKKIKELTEFYNDDCLQIDYDTFKSIKEQQRFNDLIGYKEVESKVNKLKL